MKRPYSFIVRLLRIIILGENISLLLFLVFKFTFWKEIYNEDLTERLSRTIVLRGLLERLLRVITSLVDKSKGPRVSFLACHDYGCAS